MSLHKVLNKNSQRLNSRVKAGVAANRSSRVAPNSKSLQNLMLQGAGSASLRKLSNNLSAATADRRPTAFRTTMEKKPSTLVQSRNDFFQKSFKEELSYKLPFCCFRSLPSFLVPFQRMLIN
uniref:Uncharacterized protein n=1 Tax=Quercus lobata TaxID=97700 RepID=A0A7N2RD93_QUELO